MKQLLFYIMLFFTPLSLWGQHQSISFDSRCEICDNGIDDDGDGIADCFDLDCFKYLYPEDPSGLKGEEIVTARKGQSSACLDETPSGELWSFINNNQKYLAAKGINSTREAEIELAGLATCVTSALVSATLDYSISWFELSIQGGQDKDYFSLETVREVFSKHGAAIGTNSLLACVEGVNPFKLKLGRVQQFMLNAGYGAIAGFASKAEEEYNIHSESKCSIEEIILEKLPWGEVLKSASTEAIISMLTEGIGSELGPIISSNAARAEEVIKKWFKDSKIWEELSKRFLKNASELFPNLPNLKDLPDNLKIAINDLSLSEGDLIQLNDNLRNLPFKDYLEKGGNNLLKDKIAAWKVLKDVDFVSLGFKLDVDNLEELASAFAKSRKEGVDLIADIDSFESNKSFYFFELYGIQDAVGAWLLSPTRRGEHLESIANVRGRQTKVDYYDNVTQTATSVKSTNLFAKTYQDISKLEEVWRKYVDDLAGASFPISHAGIDVGDALNPVNNRNLHLIFPHDTPSADQQSVLNSLTTYANSRGITVTFEHLE